MRRTAQSQRTDATPADLPRPRRTLWRAVAAGALTLLVGAAVLAVVGGRIAPSGASGATALEFVAALVVLVLLAIFASYAVWRARVEHLARKPGPFMVLPFVDNTRRDSHPALARELKAVFEGHLVATRLYGETAVPSTGQPNDFLTVVEAAGDQLRGAWAAASRFVRLFAPVTAFQVTCTLQTNARRGQQVVVELSRLPRTSLAPITVEGASWNEAVERAAHAVAAQVLPRTVQTRKAPWRTWEGYRIPFTLLHSYQRFQALRSQRFFDEAVAALRRAVREDPGNLAMRLELGKMQERLQMYLDALLTYDDIITLAARRDTELARWWRPSTELGRSSGDETSPRGLDPKDPTVLVARYRHAMLLGLGEKLAGQWWSRPERCRDERHRSAREERRAHLREALRTRFVRRYAALGVLPDPDATTGPLGDLRRGIDGTDRSHRAAQARMLFTELSHLEFERLADDYVRVTRREYLGEWFRIDTPASDCRAFMPWRDVGGRRRASGAASGLPRLSGRLSSPGQYYVLPREALLISMPWAVVRRAMAVRAALAAGVTPASPDGSIDRPPHRSVLADGREAFEDAGSLFRDGWIISQPTLDGVVRRLTGGPLRTWRAHFNAACVLALPLLTIDRRSRAPGGPPAQRSARAAVAELERAVACADSAFLARQREWLLTEDPDLDQLRGRAEFKDFEATTFGSIGGAVQRGPDINLWQQSAYVARFINAAAEEMGALWTRRLAGQTAGDEDRSRWLVEEMAGWRLAERLALDSRDAQTRQDVSRQIVAAGRLPGLRGPWVDHPRFSNLILDRELVSMSGGGETNLLENHRVVRTGEVSTRTATSIRIANTRLRLLAMELRLGRGGCCTLERHFVLEDEERELRRRVRSWQAGPPRGGIEGETSWCTASRDRWLALSSWFADDAFPTTTLRGRHLAVREALQHRWWTDAAPGRRAGR